MGATSEEPCDLVIGQVTAPFGIRGEVKVRPETDYPERFRDLKEVGLELPSGEQLRRRVASVRVRPKAILLRFAGCDSREAAERLRGAWIKIRRSQAVPLPENSYWVDDIIGMKVVTAEGEELGEVSEVIRAPGNDVYVTPRAMIPAVREVVTRVDLQQRLMVVSLPKEESAGAD
ncbi:MAG: ribosome maturation factor RimM [Armatimonadota bacterium]